MKKKDLEYLVSVRLLRNETLQKNQGESNRNNTNCFIAKFSIDLCDTFRIRTRCPNNGTENREVIKLICAGVEMKFPKIYRNVSTFVSLKPPRLS